MKKIYFSTLIVIFSTCSQIEVEWVKKIEPAGSGNYRINCLTCNASNIFVTGTYWTEKKDPRCLTAAYNSRGALVWHKIYGQSQFRSSAGTSILANVFGIHVLAQTTDTLGIKNVVLIKYDTLGNLLWEMVLE